MLGIQKQISIIWHFFGKTSAIFEDIGKIYYFPHDDNKPYDAIQKGPFCTINRNKIASSTPDSESIKITWTLPWENNLKNAVTEINSRRSRHSPISA